MRGWWSQKQRRKGLKQEDRNRTLHQKGKGRDSDRKRSQNQMKKLWGTRLYLGKPQCGGLVWTLFCRDWVGLGTSHRGDPMPVPPWHSTGSLCTQCQWAGLDTSGYPRRRSRVRYGSLERKEFSFLWKLYLRQWTSRRLNRARKKYLWKIHLNKYKGRAGKTQPWSWLCCQAYANTRSKFAQNLWSHYRTCCRVRRECMSVSGILIHLARSWIVYACEEGGR